ncbi:MAG: CmpA/NrtA family ABC transporter substrate-binding protein [Pseudomonadota bacterium]
MSQIPRRHGRTRTITCGFVPLTDCATLVIAHELGFAQEEGVNLVLERELSWSSIRDKLAVGLFDAAHTLAPMPVAMGLGLSRMPADVVVPFMLSANGNLIVVSARLGANAAPQPVFSTDAFAAANRLAACKPGDAPLRIGVPWQRSMHALLVQFWLERCGWREGVDHVLTIVPPPMMSDAMAAGEIDLCCVGEPWGSVAIDKGIGQLLLSATSIWAFAPEKALAVRKNVVEQRGAVIESLVRGLFRAAAWLAKPENHGPAAELLARPEYVGQPAELIDRTLSHLAVIGPSGVPQRLGGGVELFDGAATFPWRSHANWIATRMLGEASDPHAQSLAQSQAKARAEAVFRPDIYRNCLEALGVDLPAASAKLEGALATRSSVASTLGTLSIGPDAFFDGSIFEPKI